MTEGRHRTVIGRLVILAATCLFAVTFRIAGCSDVPARGVGGGTVIEVVRRTGESRFIHLHGSATIRGVLDVAGIEATIRLDRELKSGDAVFEVARDSWRTGLMNGRNLLLFGLPVPVNLADVSDLVAIDGIGPARAAAIVADRDSRGPFLQSADLARVKGIGPVTAAKISPWMSFEIDR